MPPNRHQNRIGQGWPSSGIRWRILPQGRAARFLKLKLPDMPVNFGIDDAPTCTECKNRMRLTRRTPHPVRGYDFELQTFTCRVCHHEFERNADRQGEVIT